MSMDLDGCTNDSIRKMIKLFMGHWQSSKQVHHIISLPASRFGIKFSRFGIVLPH